MRICTDHYIGYQVCSPVGSNELNTGSNISKIRVNAYLHQNHINYSEFNFPMLGVAITAIVEKNFASMFHS